MKKNLSLLMILATSFESSGAIGEFELGYLNNDLIGDSSNLSLVEEGVPLGRHSIDVSINGMDHGPMTVLFKRFRNDNIQPCFTSAQLVELGIDSKLNSDDCVFLKDLSAHATFKYYGAKSWLALSVPHAQMLRNNSGLRSTSDKWSNGIPSLKMNYNSYISSQSFNGGHSATGYLGLNFHANYGYWRLKGGGNLAINSAGVQSNLSEFYAYRDIDSIYSRVKFGEIRTSKISSINSGIPIFGLSVEKASDMYDHSWSRYVPILRGMAYSTATVSVLQGDRIVYSRVVSPGEFVIDDLDLSATGADLELVIEESNGETRRRTVAYTSLPSLLKEDSYDFSLALGKYRNSASKYNPVIASFGVEYGLKNITPSFSAFLSEDYQFTELGSSIDLGGLGAVSLTMGASAHKDVVSASESSSTGFVLKSLYAKRFERSNTNVQLVGYQYRSESFVSFEDYNQDISIHDENNSYSYFRANLKNRLEINFNQPIFNASFNLNYKRDLYHNSKHIGESLYSSINFNIDNVNFALNASMSDVVNRYVVNKDRRVGLNVSIPLGENRPQLRLSSAFAEPSETYTNRISMAGRYRDLSYNTGVTNTIDSRGESTNSFDASVTNDKSYGKLTASVRYHPDQVSGTLSASGGLIAYEHGILAARYLSDTSAIVNVGGAQGVRVNYSQETNSEGYAVIPHVSPYTVNSVTASDSKENPDVQLLEFNKRFVVRKGSTATIDIQANVGKRLLVKLNSNKNLFGKSIKRVIGHSNETFYVGNDNVVYLSGMTPGETTSFYVEGGTCNFDIFVDQNTQSLKELTQVQCK